MRYLNDDISVLNLDSNINSLLSVNGVNKVCDLYVLNRKVLKGFGLSDSNINLISIKLQLVGLDLYGKKY